SMCRAFKASNLDPGGFAEYVRVPPANVHHATFKLPAHLTDEEASFVEPLGCCARAVERARVVPGDTAVVVGLGSIGCLFVQLFARAGATVVGADQDVTRLELARRFGVTAALPADAATLARQAYCGRGAAHGVITGGAAAVVPLAVPATGDAGAIPYR